VEELAESIKKVAFLVAICLAVVIFFILTNEPETEPMDADELYASVNKDQSEKNPDTDENISSGSSIVDVKGEVKKPGVYEVSTEYRVNDVIQMAGGFTEDADESQINLAQKVHDEMIIVVFKLGDEPSSEENNTGRDSTGKVRINYATQEEIETLNGVGPSKAQAIIQYRDENGLFQSAEDLLQVSGIGEKTLENFRDQLQIP